MHDKSSTFGGRLPGAPWRWAICLLAALWVAVNLWTAARLLLKPELPDTASHTGAVALPGAAGSDSREPVDIDTIASWHLFGEGRSAQPQADAGLDELEASAAVTALELTLQGIIMGHDAAETSAIVHVGGTQRRYRIGDRLPIGDQVSLAKVLPDRAVLRNGNRFEILWLYAPHARAVDAGAAIVSKNETLASARGEEANLPSATVVVLADVIEISEHRAGPKLVGYHAAPGRDAAMFERLGLQPGDLITAVNGIDFEAAGVTLENYNPLQLSSEATLVIRRGTETITLFVTTNA